MRIGELSRLSGISTSRIRFYEKHKLIPVAEREQNGYRNYPESITTRIRTILLCQELGFSLVEIRRALPDSPAEMMRCGDIIQKLNTKLIDVDQHISELKALKSKLRKILDYFEHGRQKGEHADLATLYAQVIQ